MQNKIASVIFSTRIMAVLFVVFPVAMAFGTFIESWYSIETARVLIYNTWWFEGIMVFFVINFAGNIKRYKLHKREKWSSLLIHLSFLLILVGAFITRYISYEGVMPITEGETTNIMLSQKTYFTAFIDGEIEGEPRRRVLEEPVLFAPETENDYILNTDYNGQPVTIEATNFIYGAKEELVPAEDGENHLKLVEAGGGGRHDHYLKEGEVQNIHNVLFALNEPTEGAINITYTEETGKYTINSPFEGDYMRMADQEKGGLAKDSTQNLMLRSLYNIGTMQFVIPEPVVKGKYDIIKTPEKTDGQSDALTLKVSSEGESETVTIMGGQGIPSEPQKVELAGLEFYLNYGSKEIELPFALKLNDFIANRYPGTENSYSSFKSKVEIVEEGKENVPYEIYMNHVLDHKGFRFFQASFMPDESGTVLSVNHDFWGTWVTYIGYFLLYLGLMLILFDKGSRFGNLKDMLEKVKDKKKKLSTVLIFFMATGSMFAQIPGDEHEHAESAKREVDSIIKSNAISEEHAAKFGRLVIQDAGGRMKPANTYSSELLRKLSKSDEYEGLSSDQVLVSLTQNPMIWYNVPVIYVEKNNDSLHNLLGVEQGEKYLTLSSFFDEMGNYKLSPQLEDAYQAAVPNKFQKDFINTDKKVNLLYRALQGKILRIFPIPEDENNKWVSYPELEDEGVVFKGMDSVYTKQILPLYMTSLSDATETGDYTKANQFLESIKGFQKKFGSEVLPSEDKINAEIAYNKYDIFRNLFWMYMVAGLFMLVIVIVKIFKENNLTKWLVKISAGVIIILFVLHTLGLIGRWYISGHAPWSDAYESMIYVGWATMFFGLAFGRKSTLTIASTAFVTSMILMIAHWNWMDPSIANLQPVLDSYWLMIHVSVIVGSYGPFTLGMILGAVALLLMIFTTEKNKKKMDLNIKEITIITEMALTVGLVMLTIGNFLGGQWANESWGRYWGWDPKETWALISIMVYAFVIHMRLVPGLRSRWFFNLMAVVSFASIMMTYFGVNFYLAGLHSYASGDKVITPTFIYYAIAVVALLGAVSYWRFQKFYAKKPKKKIEK
ncbi:cytochrome c biogenesis protein CcsA [Salegentibacter salegens]|uniref:Cytochrome c-type biogenesis protein CcsB n=1 Tax=Salegentibacter salegens TaxID=143223 RepID=A0A1M7LHC9_9FLAO|nr:cytochrome c biogenesis protein CcsA [Salegentibacter salegens]PRX50665.1 cytochrome c-type biogenesis protein CcsB [Salegentibacter salegens]SHM77453.1 cytochrome c-type biogenesis protein CcsB [Salegentibacter salegens]